MPGSGLLPPACGFASKPLPWRIVHLKQFDVFAAILLVVGGLNWGLVAVGNLDLVAAWTGAEGFGAKNMLGVIVYGLVGMAAIYQALAWKAIQRRWQAQA